eukprot:jgi/Hompol1/6803/HPOL_001207-RA
MSAQIWLNHNALTGPIPDSLGNLVLLQELPSPPSPLSPDPGYSSIILQIPFLGRAQPYSFPPTSRFPQLYVLPRLTSATEDLYSQHTMKSASVSSPILNAVPIICTPGRFFSLFERSLESLWTCWELMMLGEPIFVIGDTPTACSEVVWALIELIKPIPFGGDFRPYFTIQDADFKRLTARSRLAALYQICKTCSIKPSLNASTISINHFSAKIDG